MQKRFTLIVISHRACHKLFLPPSVITFFCFIFLCWPLVVTSHTSRYYKHLYMIKKRNFNFSQRGYITFRILFLTQHLLMFHYYKGGDPLAHTSTSTSFCRSSGEKETKPNDSIDHQLHTQGKIEKITNIYIYIHLFQGNNRLLYKIHTLKPLCEP